MAVAEMQLTKFVRIQLTIFTILTVVSLTVMGLQFIQIPAMFGIGRYDVTVELAGNGNLYKTANVTYRGETVGRVTEIKPAADGVVAALSMYSSHKIPADVDANVHSRSAIGEQYVDLVPRTSSAPYLHAGSVIPRERTSIPGDIGTLLDTVNQSLKALPAGNLHTLIEESYLAFNGTGPAVGRLLDSAHGLSADGLDNITPLTTLINDAGPVIDATVASDASIRAWTANVNSLTAQLAAGDTTLRDLLQHGRAAADQATSLFQKLQPTLPILLSNLVSVGQVAVTYNPSLEQILVLLPAVAAAFNTLGFTNRDGSKMPFLSFKLGLNVPAPCTVGFLPASERRDASAEDAPPRTDQPLYCALPQTDPNAVRGARNYPCMNNPDKRAPTVDICKSDQEYQPLGTNPWIGESQKYIDNPQFHPSSYTGPASGSGAPPGASVTTALYNPDGSYLGSDGLRYRQLDVAANSGTPGKESTWQTMLTPTP
ncbi:MCE family protein [Nocardia sp. NBC_01388]|uniref:MCE family protein n=1 Tax=Nocardia sp. NBC_01388 TaxID=2903596 RepID=UPI00324574F6